MNRRGSGILLHITSLPSAYGIGDFGPQAYEFIDFLSETRQSVWQILPLNPTSTAHGNSPYSSCSAYAGNHILISPDLLVKEGLLSTSDISTHGINRSSDRVEYHSVTSFKEKILRKAYENFKDRAGIVHEFVRFCRENSSWLDDYSLYITLKEHFHGAVWSDWPEELRFREETAINEWRERLQDRIEMEKFIQYVFFYQWFSLKNYCHSKNIQIIGDIPIYVTYDSADVWANPEYFKLDEERRPLFVAGVPPDYFSDTGQRWGNPVYRWDVLKGNGFSWWIQRLEHNLKLYDIVRLDHFRGFVAYWEIAAEEDNAINGKWVEVPVHDFFNTLLRHFPSLPVIAEDLGVITPDVTVVMNEFGFPGMKLLIFAFGEDIATNPYIPHNCIKNCVVFTGTHDNNTIRGWFENEAAEEDVQRVFRYFGGEITPHNIHRVFIRLAMMSVANTVIIPMQDILGLGEESRMNLPATTMENWGWRLLPELITPELKNELSEMTQIYCRG